MEILRKATFAEVEREFKKQYRVKSQAQHVSDWCLHWTERKVGNWHKVKLNRDDILAILLPAHAHPKKHLVSHHGGLLKNVLKRKIQYNTTDQKCWQTIKHFKHLEFSPLFLSTKRKAMGHYHDLKKIDTKLYHVDGLHRLIAWGLDGRFSDDYLKTNPLYAYVAMGRRFQFLHLLRSKLL